MCDHVGRRPISPRFGVYFAEATGSLLLKNLRWLTLSGFAILAAMAFLTTRTQAQPGQVSLVVPGVWFREGDLEKLGHCNNTIIEMKDYLIVVDANFPSGARLALETARR